MDDLARNEYRRGPFHSSGSVAASRTGLSSAATARNPLYSSGSVASGRAGSASSAGIRSALRSSGSVAVARDPSKAAYWPGPEQVPESLAEVGVRQSVLEELALKTLYISGPFSLRELVSQMRLP